jgi:hypothetical protein
MLDPANASCAVRVAGSSGRSPRRRVSGDRYGVRFDQANHVGRLETHPAPVTHHRTHESSGHKNPSHSRATAYSTVTTALTTFSTVDVS